ncbi:16S rRNA (cytosine(1402)-N(4))-methyltransferase RsmH [Sporolactobacillus shoreicorticis]|uniref:Ribosomal RNA small subunit methyltransferase H n=1 Tax=Sporolactobacillus shoreicorticis TaxID=1923877 RepID=A0ABW5S754_9BACL|nr:16S rRNA (cytosine(1402)-N(4))-methyltransferase RsmH [Sporolactobacillus shoreicorticis]MCO7126290.1 16S rRNA (cytosine(1402)-N(4))-methyltransferase RsmH [Sporolactobacillus shoreicorticis]
MFEHVTVLKKEAIKGLKLNPDGIYVDCTLGGGGHSEAIAAQLENGHLYAFDQDDEALNAASERLKAYSGEITLIKANFRHLERELRQRGVLQVNGILFDLGVSSPQFDHADRGFSYQHDGPLDMRMDQQQQLTAAAIVNEWPTDRLARIFFMYGEERFSRQIARKIEKYRENKSIDMTGELVEIIKDAIPAPARRKGGHPAKRIFQALRIAVNDELGSFDEALSQSLRMLAVGGRIAVITFQSLEDKLCKQFFKKYSESPELPPGLPVVSDAFLPVLKKVGRKPVVPSEEEVTVNNRSRSAKLRVAEKVREIKEDEKQ